MEEKDVDIKARFRKWMSKTKRKMENHILKTP